MNRRESFQASFPAIVDEIAARWAPKIVFFVTIIIAVCTLYPFKFTLGQGTLFHQIVTQFRSSSDWMDAWANIVLFAPLGFGLASGLAKRRYPLVTQLLATIVICGAMSLTIELLQVFLPGRKATPFDVLTNTMGGGVGYVCFVWFKVPVYWLLTLVVDRVQRFFARFSLKQLAIALASYTVFAALLVFFWQGNSLGGWDANLSLTIGNNPQLKNPWQGFVQALPWEGTVKDLTVRDRSLSKMEIEDFFKSPSADLANRASLLAVYDLTGPKGLQDQTGGSPELTWQGIQPRSQTAAPQTPSLTAGRWLTSSEPVTMISQRIQEASQFTLGATISAAQSTAPLRSFRRIVSFSSPVSFGSLVLTQVQSDLNVWLRTSKGENDLLPYRLNVPAVFSDQQPHRILVTYSGFVLRVHVDSSDRFFVLDLTPNRYQIILYGLILVPLAFLLGLLANRLRHQLPIYLALVAGGTVLPSLLLEIFLANEGDRNIRIANLLLGMVIVGGTLIACKSHSLRGVNWRSTAS